MKGDDFREIANRIASQKKAQDYMLRLRSDTAIGVVEAQLAALNKILSEGPAGVVAERLARWATTASQALTEAISPGEGANFRERAFRAAGIFRKQRQDLSGVVDCRNFLEAFTRDL